MKKKAKVPISANPKIEFTWRKNYKAQREDAQNIIAQVRVNMSCYEWEDGNYEDEEK
jgi:hypothetical protein